MTDKYAQCANCGAESYDYAHITFSSQQTGDIVFNAVLCGTCTDILKDASHLNISAVQGD